MRAQARVICYPVRGMSRVCSAAGCQNVASHDPYCKKHYLKLVYHPSRPRCTVAGCTKRQNARGLCAMHYTRARQGVAFLTERETFLRDHPPRNGTGLVPVMAGKKLLVATVDAADYARVIAHSWSGGSERADGTQKPVTVIGGKKCQLGRFVLGASGRKRVLYRDKDYFNCRRSNLLVATQAHATRTQRAQRRAGKTSRFKGVYRKPGTSWFEARITCRGRQHFLGCFRGEAEAALAYDE